MTEPIRLGIIFRDADNRELVSLVASTICSTTPDEAFNCSLEILEVANCLASAQVRQSMVN